MQKLKAQKYMRNNINAVQGHLSEYYLILDMNIHDLWYKIITIPSRKRAHYGISAHHRSISC